MPGPRTLHRPGRASRCTPSRRPPLVDLLIGTLLDAGARAGPAGRVHAAGVPGRQEGPDRRPRPSWPSSRPATDDELQQALGQLAGGVTQPLHGLRDDLLNLLADVEAGLDFADEDIQFVDKKDAAAAARRRGWRSSRTCAKQLDDRAVSGRPFRVVLVGRAERRQEQPVQRPGRRAGRDRQPGAGHDARLPHAGRSTCSGDERRVDRHGRLAGGGRQHRGAGPAARPRAVRTARTWCSWCVDAGDWPNAERRRHDRCGPSPA